MPEQPEPRCLTDNELLGWLVVEAYRQNQRRDGVRLLVRPWPLCPVCGVRATSRTMSTSPATFDTTMILEPCGHALVASDVAIAGLWETAEINARHVANIEAVIGRHLAAPAPEAAEDQPDYPSGDPVACAHCAKPITSYPVIREWVPGGTGRSWHGDQPDCDPHAREAAASVAPGARRRRALARNAVGPALNVHGHWLPLSVREAVADAVLAAADRAPADTTPADEGAADRRYWTGCYDKDPS
ncbi:hypothetical protein ACIQVR_39470 [Streptomyces xanthochromogenes]|uniref:hypothetical protein n=1 Tax=Streptomyces xanthochromogenes TaxID=67384 RepID=UPI00381B9197